MNLIVGERPIRVMASGAQDVNHLDEVVDGRPADMLDNAFVIVDYPSGARAMLDLCMFAEATHNQEELSVVGAAGKVEALIPESTVRIGRRGEHWIGGVESYRVDDAGIAHEGLHHGSSYLEHVHFLDAVRARHAPPRSPLDDGLWSVAMGVAAHRSIELGRPVELAEVLRPASRGHDAPATTPHRSHRTENSHDHRPPPPAPSRWRGSAPSATTTTSSSGVPDPLLASSFEHCRNIVLTADRYGFDNVLLPSGYAARHRQHRVRRGDGAADDAAHAARRALRRARRAPARPPAGDARPDHGRPPDRQHHLQRRPRRELASGPRYRRSTEIMFALRELLDGHAVKFHGDFVDLEIDPPRVAHRSAAAARCSTSAGCRPTRASAPPPAPTCS